MNRHWVWVGILGGLLVIGIAGLSLAGGRFQPPDPRPMHATNEIDTDPNIVPRATLTLFSTASASPTLTSTETLQISPTLTETLFPTQTTTLPASATVPVFLNPPPPPVGLYFAWRSTCDYGVTVGWEKSNIPKVMYELTITNMVTGAEFTANLANNAYVLVNWNGYYWSPDDPVRMNVKAYLIGANGTKYKSAPSTLTERCKKN